MKLVVLFPIIVFSCSVASLEIVPPDDKTIEYYLAELFHGGDPSTFEVIETEVKKHSGELLNGFLSLVGGNFDFEDSDLKKQVKTFEQEFDVEKLKKIAEDIFGIGSAVVSQLQKDSATIKDKIFALIDHMLSQFSSARKKRAIREGFENFSDIFEPKSGNEDSDSPENDQVKSNRKKEQLRNSVPHTKQNSETKEPVKGILKDSLRGILGDKDQKNDDDQYSNDTPIMGDAPRKGLLNSLIPDSMIQKNDDDKGRKYVMSPKVRDELMNDLEDKTEQAQHDVSTKKKESKNGLRDSVIPPKKRDSNKERPSLVRDMSTQLDDEENHSSGDQRDNGGKEKSKKGFGYTEIGEKLKRFTNVAIEFIDDVIGLGQDRQETFMREAKDSMKTAQSYMAESRDRALDFFKTYWKSLYDIVCKSAENIKKI